MKESNTSQLQKLETNIKMQALSEDFIAMWYIYSIVCSIAKGAVQY